MANSKKTSELIDAKTLEKIKSDLLKEKAQILKDLGDVSQKDSHDVDNRGSKFPEYGDKPDENAQEISEYSTSVVTEKVLDDTLEDIEKTLKRIDKGEYGSCKYCGEPINIKRLLARPTANSCVKCKTELQQNE
jgi:DnaK suppressor protein